VTGKKRRTNASRRRARRRFEASQAEAAAVSASAGRPNEASSVAQPADAAPPIQVERPSVVRRPYERMAYYSSFKDDSDTEPLPDIGSDGEQRHVEEVWEPPVPPRPPSTPPPPALSPPRATDTPPAVLSPSPVRQLTVSSSSESELALSICSEDEFSDLETSAALPRIIHGYDPEFPGPSAPPLSRAQRLVRRLFATPSPKRGKR